MKSALSIVAFALLLSPALHAEAGPFSGMVVFGDSHSDVGNWDAVYKAPDWTPYDFEHRASNGPLWVDILAVELGLPPPTPSGAGGSNYAWQGARTGNGLDYDGALGFPRVGNQVDQYLASHQPRNDELFVIFVGQNDFGAAGQGKSAVPVANLSEHIRELATAGATHFVVPNLHPLGHLPAYRGSTRETPLNQMTAEFNALLSEDLSRLARDLAIKIYPLDFHGLVEQMIAAPATHGLANVTQPAVTNRGVVANPGQFLYRDQHHFASAAHQLLAQEALRIVPEPEGIWLAALAVLAVAGGHVCAVVSRGFGRRLRWLRPVKD